jgi:hypothetical protein
MKRDFAAYDSKWFAVTIGAQVIRGRSTYIYDPTLGSALSIAVEPGAEILLQEREYAGEITPDESHGCDFLLSLPVVETSAK